MTTREQSPLSLSLAYDLALRKFEMVDRTFDALNTRAAALIGLTALLITTSRDVVGRLRGYPFSWIAPVFICASIGYLLWNCVHAYRIRDVDALPSPSNFYTAFAASPEDETRREVISSLDLASKTNLELCKKKSEHIRRGLAVFVLLIAILVPLSFLLPETR